jgi:uncharacterized membrane protein
MDDDGGPAEGDRDAEQRRATGDWRRWAPWVVIVAFAASGVVHLVHPRTFTRMVPGFLPAKTALVYVSGVVELGCATALIRRDRWAGVVAAALLLVIWPANLQAAIDAQGGSDTARKIELWVRLPLQIPLIWCALQSRAVQSRPARRRPG